MSPRVLLTALFAACVLFVPAAASQPEGLAGKLIANPDTSSDPNACDILSFDWYEFFFDRQLDSADTLTLEMSLIPFRSGLTSVLLSDSNGSNFAYLNFSDGMVNGMPYERARWNDITMLMRPATQDYLLTINGFQGGPFPYDSYCQQEGGCFTVNALRVLGADNPDEGIAWIDTIAVLWDSAAGQEFIMEEKFDSCNVPEVASGGLLQAPFRSGAGPRSGLLKQVIEKAPGQGAAARELETLIGKLEAARDRSIARREADALIARARGVLALLTRD